LVPTAAKTLSLGILAAVAFVVFLAGVNELVVLAGGGAVAAGLHMVRTGRARHLWSMWLPLLVAPRDDVGLWPLLLTFLRIGSVLYGSGYVLLAFLQGDLVHRLGWITERQLLDAVSIGQVTPGPVFTTATFVGYLVAGTWGAVVATVGIFLPSFAFVALLSRLVGWMRSSPTLGAALDGINATAIALMAGVGLQLAGDAVVDVLTLALAALAGLALWRTPLNSAWLIAGGATVGLAHTLAT
jgi:chromate transporter